MISENDRQSGREREGDTPVRESERASERSFSGSGREIKLEKEGENEEMPKKCLC